MKLLRWRGETLTLATTVGFPQVLGAPPGMNCVVLETPSATLENISVILTPKIKKVWFYDASASTYTDLTANLTDRNTSNTSGSSLNEMQTADFLYVGCERRYRGMAVDVVNTNSLGTAAALATYYNGTTWANITPTDGTLSTRTLAQDGLITWTVPTNWALTTVNNSPSLYWVRYAVDAALTDTSVSIGELVALANLTLNSANTDAEGYDYMLTQSNNRTLPPYRLNFNNNDIGGLEMKSASITSAANVTWLQVA